MPMINIYHRHFVYEYINIDMNIKSKSGMGSIDINIINSIIFGITKNLLSNKKGFIDYSEEKINSLYNLSILYVQFDYFVNTKISSLGLIKTYDDIIENSAFLSKIKLFIEKNYNCCVDDDMFEKVLQEVILAIKFEIQSIK